MKDAPEELIWHGQQEDILKDWAEMAASYRWLHSRSYNEYKKQNILKQIETQIKTLESIIKIEEKSITEN